MQDISKTLVAQLRFITETDKLKGVERRTKPIGLARRENSAEHSWQAAICAMILAEHADAEVNLLRVLKMLLIHDVVEVDTGDVFHYEKKEHQDLAAREAAAAKRIFELLPDTQAQELLSLWQEFETRHTPDARFAAAVDRLMAYILNRANNGGTWTEYQLTEREVRTRNREMREGSSTLWGWCESVIDEAVQLGHLAGHGISKSDGE
ncbi:MAG TPA: HD domain-containing protein [Oligoflexia bacterium]|nr:HD domain-containing protein [Oligoflexia bacterium]